ncbi:hypothetical protein ACEW7V_01995 [Areca yellow leaf disease phytoplasma]|uniref:hypothetical protein n=1 Tax=Areca yellow leaf disease phytoplasma TaxID=927614 RepID=UPI0035B4FEDC
MKEFWENLKNFGSKLYYDGFKNWIKYFMFWHQSHWFRSVESQCFRFANSFMYCLFIYYNSCFFSLFLTKKKSFIFKFRRFFFKTFFSRQKLLKTILKLSITLTIGKFIYEGGRMFTLFMVDSTFDKPFLAGTPFEFKGLGGLGAIGVADSIITLLAQISSFR